MELKSNKVMFKGMPPREIFQRFRKEEEGALIIFSLMMLVMILWLGGMAVDFMRYETTRAKLQGTLDRATLAAADLDQILPPADVCLDYFVKAGMEQFLDSCVVDQGINFRIVTANASAPMPLFFHDISKVFSSPSSPGTGYITVSGSSSAEERVTDVEVSLVLDVSSSMNSNNRMANMRGAAREFVTTVLANNTDAPQGLITISMIPYSAVVNPGTDIAPHLTGIERTHWYSTCPMFDDSEFTTTTLNLGASYDQVSHFSFGGSDDIPINPNYTWCFADNLNAVQPHSTNEAKLHTAIDNLHGYGNTAIDMGVKWGVALLDPSIQSLISSLAGASGTGVPANASGRPELYTEPDVLKVLVLMTDGQNTQQWDLVEPYKSGMSPVWFDLDDVNQPLWDVDFNDTSVQFEGESTSSRWDDKFYWNVRSRTRNYPRGFDNRSTYANASSVGNSGLGEGTLYGDDDDDYKLYNASWQELFANRSYRDINDYYFREVYDEGKWSWSEFYATDLSIDHSVVIGSEADARLSNICAVARTQGIVIYTIAFEAPSGGQTALQDCASSPSHYFDVDGVDISGAFAAIASDIRNLKLTQ